MANDDAFRIEIDVDFDEWLEVMKILRGVAAHEDRPFGFVRFVGDGSRHRWYAFDGHRSIRMFGQPDAQTFDVLVPPRLILMAPQVCSSESMTRLIVESTPGDVPTIMIQGDAGSVAVPFRNGGFPDVESILTRFSRETADTQIDAAQLRRALESIGTRPEFTPQDQTPPPLTVGLDDEGLWFRISWPESGPTVLSLNCAGTDQPKFKQMLLSDIGEFAALFDGPIDVSFGADPNEPLVLSSDNVVCVLDSLRTGVERSRPHVEEVITEVFGVEGTNTDEDGDYLLKTTGIPVWGRLISDDPSYLSVFATLLTEVEGTPDLLAELNDLNSNLTFVRVDWRDGLVTARVDLVANTLDPAELFTAFKRVNDAAANISPMLNAMFGGDTLDRDAERWSAYLETTITAEIVPNTIESLNGPTASEQWLFDSPVHVITAWNPYNIIRSPEENDRANTELAIALARRGARFASARGSANDGLHFEDSFITWNLTRDEAIELGREFRQEAVFELTPDEFRLVHCGTGAVTSAPRT